ncbi:MAG: NlpC/P60 family protein [Actinomycetota bacterium]
MRGPAIAFAFLPAALLGLIVLPLVASAGGAGSSAFASEPREASPGPDAADIPPDMLNLYRAAAQTCPGLPWTVLAGVGEVETRHGGLAGGRRYPLRAGLGWALDIRSPAGARGPMQFLPATWAAYGLDADGDGAANVDDPVDAVHGAARYLCANGAGDPARLRGALFAYNHADWYVDDVLARAAGYRGAGWVEPDSGGAGRPDVAAYALRFLGVPYVWGGEDPARGFDCSGLTKYVWAAFGVSMAHYTVSQWRAFRRVPRGEELPGDLVFFAGSGGEPPAHMGLYIGGGRFVHAPHRGDVVRVGALADRADYMGAVRPGPPSP